MEVGQTLEIEATVISTTTEIVFDLGNQSQSTDLAPWFSGPMDYWHYRNLTTASADPIRGISQCTDYYIENRGKGQNTSSQRTVRPDNSCYFGIIVQKNEHGWIWNTSFVMTSRWNQTNNEMFGTFAQGYHTYYQQYLAKWRVSHSAVLLSSAKPLDRLPTPEEHAQSNESTIPIVMISTIEKTCSLTQDSYLFSFIDYNWEYSGDFTYRPQTMRQRAAIYTDTTLVAAMI